MRKNIRYAASRLIRRQRHCQFRVHDGKHRTDQFTAQIALNALIGNHRAVRALRPCRCDGENAGNRHRFFYFFVANIEIFPSIAVVVYAHSNAFGSIRHTAAAYSQQHVHILFFHDIHAFQRQLIPRIRLYSAKLYIRNIRFFQRFAHTAQQSGFFRALAPIHYQYLFRRIGSQIGTNVVFFPFAKYIFGRRIVAKIVHRIHLQIN